MKDFDALRSSREQHDRTFKLGGEIFTFRASIVPEEAAELYDHLDGFTPPLPLLEEVALVERAIKTFLEPGCRDLWDRVRAEADPPITHEDIQRTVGYILEVILGRPILQLDGSGGTPSSTGTRSTGVSDSRAALASVPSASASS